MGDRFKKNTTKKQGSVPPRNAQQNRTGNSCEEEMDTEDISEISNSVRDPRNARAQTQKQIQRSAEASKHMVFGVFGNVIKILEEFERRENVMIGQKLSMPQSDISIPNQSDKEFDDIESIVTTQLLLFETQSRACPPEVLAEVIDELKRLTISWAAVREEMGIQGVHKTDAYIAKLYEILAKGKTQHNIPDSSSVTAEDMKENFPKVMKGVHDKNMVDKAYRENEAKKATAPKTRGSEMIHEGAQRLAKASKDREIGAHLQNDVEKMESDKMPDMK